MKYSGKLGEYVVLARLLANEIEAYPAIKTNQDSYDLTAILMSNRIVRIQVKTTQLNNLSTNNTIGDLKREFDFLVIVVMISKQDSECYVLTRSEAHALRGSSTQFGISRKVKGTSLVKSELAQHREQWSRVRDA